MPEGNFDHQDSRHISKNQLLWQEKRKYIDGVKDKLGRGVDNGIKDTVICLQLAGVNTTQSCEGHLDWGVGAPWVELSAPASQKLKELELQRQKTIQDAEELERIVQPHEGLNRLYYISHKLQREIKQLNLQEADKLIPYLDRFYSGRNVSFRRRLTISFLANGCSRLQSQGAEFQDTLSKDMRSAYLSEYQREMEEFTSFVKESFFSS